MNPELPPKAFTFEASDPREPRKYLGTKYFDHFLYVLWIHIPSSIDKERNI